MIPLTSARILVVDDEPVNVKLAEKALRTAGYEHIISTTDPREAVKHYAEQGSDLVLLDLNMPHMDGFEVLARIREMDHGDYPPVLVLTAQGDRETRLRALSEGARDYVTKPFDIAELLTRIRNLLEVRLLQNQIRGQNLILEQKVAERTRELHDTRLEIIRRLGRAAEYRDNETGLHIIRMSKISMVLGRAAGMSEAEAELLLNASPMHDIGKIGIPDRILLKPGKLDAAEWETMKAHAAIGAEILSGHESELLRMAAEIAYCHHEKWDGSGYPRGLKGNDIPLTGRVVALADVFDALTSERPYKKAWPVEEAMAEIRRLSGSHFDPALVVHFQEVLPEVLAIRAQYAEPAHAA